MNLAEFVSIIEDMRDTKFRVFNVFRERPEKQITRTWIARYMGVGRMNPNHIRLLEELCSEGLLEKQAEPYHNMIKERFLYSLNPSLAEAAELSLL